MYTLEIKFVLFCSVLNMIRVNDVTVDLHCYSEVTHQYFFLHTFSYEDDL